MQVIPYLCFKGDCEAALKFYEQCLDGECGEIFRYAESPMASQVPAEWGDKVMHGNFTLAGRTFQAADVLPEQYQEPTGFSLSLQLSSAVEAERIFADLSDGGKVLIPLEKTFWAERFGSVVDRFKITWLINCDGGGPDPETATL
jgi:PhnB protein